jgi:hypothetical protein
MARFQTDVAALALSLFLFASAQESRSLRIAQTAAKPNKRALVDLGRPLDLK